jgi:ABC-type uncharacterized transport system YnjBCD substrate-binding protein
MRRTTLILAAAALLATAAVTAADAKTCVNKAGQGTNSTEDGAKFQAWEAVLQATDWGSWAQFMAGSQKIGVAPGYTVSNLKSKCTKGGLGSECVVQAQLCK